MSTYQRRQRQRELLRSVGFGLLTVVIVIAAVLLVMVGLTYAGR